ncbi:class I SAM-dependent methyltransferase [Anabaena sp. UHCC 0451]|uniref:class I SAM-dependent methyltransferase n=1 Tax=Anabaena sp. UHCC 0451 TaxID=2055235 RepID=UPI002B21D079|nr:class I SAM-dependent methyltransferase [Anabaena sp. UHCC 0451]MEA5575972.1 class I SAM-dependent methyltransferase [Anabaena sp. UHCC 0451]
MKFKKYLEFKQYIWSNYQPYAQELSPIEEGYKTGTNWAKRNAPRFFRALQVIDSLITEANFTLIDVGAYPGSFSRLAKASFGESITEIHACGMTPDEDFKKLLATEEINFFPCNLDPDIQSPFNIPVGLPLADNSVDCIVLMEVVEHLYSLKTIMLECYRVLKPNGICYITTNNISDRVGLLRLLCKNSTNLDEDLEQTSIWSDYKNTWRGHVRFFSLNQLCEVGMKSGFKIERASYFQHYEDPDVYIHKEEANIFSRILRNKLKGDGSRPPLWLKMYAQSIWHLGIKSLSISYSSHIEIVYRKPS